ncbi:MAG: hypothetical protein MJ094_04150 [Saccharofermentans sp.]|nr:hypothetical protein [Saccharofermentans sp.]
MAVLTRLASTLTARYFPSQTLTDAFYIDGRLFGKRETRQADITIEKNERGYFLSLFAHPKLAEYEPSMGMMPPYEPELRGTCNEVKFSHKEIDGMIEGFLTTAVDVTGKSRITDAGDRSPYFSGVIVRDSEAFAVTIGTGLAFLYRDDTLYPLTDAGIPMEPIDAKGNRVADFLYYCSSKTANALWSNFFTLNQDDCIILCNKEVYDALGQRELLRILDEAEDQCDAAGVVITQASARIPDVPMQFAISFVEDVVSDEKKGLFGFRKKVKEEDLSDMSVESTMDGGVVGAAATAASAAGFAGSMTIEDYQQPNSSVFFGDTNNVTPPATNQQATGDMGFVVNNPAPAPKSDDSFVQFLDPSVGKDVSEVSAEDLMKSLFADSVAATGAAAATTAAVATTAAATEASVAAATTVAGAEVAAASADNIFVSQAVNPFDSVKLDPVEPTVPASSFVAATTFNFDTESDADKTKPIERLDPTVIEQLTKEGQANDAKAADAPTVVADAVKEMENLFVQPVVTPVPDVTVPEVPVNDAGAFVFSAATETPVIAAPAPVDASSAFDPYSVGSSEEMQNAEPIVFGETGAPVVASEEELKEATNSIPVPEFEFSSEKPELKDSDKLGVDFPVVKEAPAPVEEIKEEPVVDENSFSLPFENAVETIEEPAAPAKAPDDIPEMPLFDANTFVTPVATTNADAPVNAVEEGVYTAGQFVTNENMADPNEAPYQPDNLDFATPVAPVQPAQMPVQPVAPVAPVAPVEIPVQQAYDPYSQQASYQAYGEEPYGDAAYSYTPGQYQENYSQAQSEQPAGEDNDWINSILGISDYADPTPTQDPYMNGGTPMTDNGYGYNNAQPTNYGAPTMTRSQTATPKPRTSSSGSGNGGNGGKRTKRRLNRNGYMFLAFVIVCLVCLIILISAIVRSCGKDDAALAETEATRIEETFAPIETEPAATTSSDPSAPIGMFQFSDNIGYRTWWDLFNNVYGINDIANTSDPRISIIVSYNGLDASYSPNSGDALLLPPVGVLDGTIPVTFRVGGSTGATENAVSGEVQTIDGPADNGDAVVEPEPDTLPEA